ncbi:hypothetical protein H4S01_004713, partial [Coemansia sp. RSA 2610]
MADADQHSPSTSRESSADIHGNPHPLAEHLTVASTAAAPGHAQVKRSSSKDPTAARYLRACDNCRRRKVKCNGNRPSCDHCTRVDVACHYSIKPKSRRMWKCLETPEAVAAPGAPVAAAAATNDKRALDDTTAKLLARVETMERLLMQRNGVNSPRMTAGHGVFGGSDDMAGSGSVASFSARSGQRPGDAATDAGFAYVGAGSANGPAGVQSHASSGIPSRKDSGGGSADAPHQQLLESVLSGDHQGSTISTSDSHAHMQAPSTLLGTMSPSLVNDLIDVLFAGTNHISELLNEQTFRKQFAAGTISPLLLYSSLASAARYSKHPAVRTDPPYSASAPFINRAKALVVDAIEEPSLGNAQGLVIMCMMHFSLGNEVVTTSYKSLALNMCIMLGFNRLDSVNGPVQPNSNCTHDLMTASTMSMDWVDREAARRLWWTIFSIENYSSVCMGLAPSIQAEYCDVNLPASTVEWTQGRPLSEPDLDMPNKRVRLDNPIHQLAAYHAQLSLIFSKVAWLVTRTSTGTEEAVAQFSELNTVLQRWYEGLPKELRLSSVDSLLYGNQESSDYYHICVLHMRFYTTVIQLNHAIPEFTEDSSVIEPGQRKCVIAASRISDLLRSSFEITVELRNMDWYMCVFRAAHIHIYRLLSRDPESIARAKQDLAIHRRHLREGGPLWRICYKLLNRLDDMEQMVMLLPAQIPVADLIKIKHLTRKGKSQLVNMQLDALIKPTLIHSEHGDSEDLPLAARVEMSSGGSRQPARDASEPTLPSVTTGAVDASSLYGIIGHAKTSSPESTASGSTMGSHTHPFTPMPMGAGIAASLGQQPSGIAANMSFSDAIGPPLGPLTVDRSSTSQLPAEKSHASLTNIPAPVLQLASELPAINTNIVIDNNMAETLVNYFYMVASNSQASQSPSLGPSQGQLSQLPGQGGSAISLSSPQLVTNGSMAPALPTAMSAAASVASSHGQRQQQQQQSLFGSAYDLSRLQSLADDNS